MSEIKQRAGKPARAPRTDAASVDPAEVARFDALAETWWDGDGPMRALHRLNPIRLDYLRRHLLRHFALSEGSLRPLEGLRAVDVGCGGGILSEPLARLGAEVTAIDVSSENIEIARRHAASAGIEIDYRLSSAETLAGAGARFDMLVSMEVVEHVADLDGFLAAAATLLKPGGAAFFATLNRTAKSYLMAIVGAEYLLGWLPKGTHRWDRFVRPAELRRRLEANGLELRDVAGVSFDAVGGAWRRSSDLSVNYMAYAGKA